MLAKRINTPQVSAFLAWSFLFTPALLHDSSWIAWILVPASALLIWPLTATRIVLIPALITLSLLGAINIFHIGFFGYLADEFFIATALRSNQNEMKEFVQTLPALQIAQVLAWCMAAFFASKTIIRSRSHGSYTAPRTSYLCAMLIWAALAAWGVSKKMDSTTFFQKMHRVYPMHLVQASFRHHEMEQGLFYHPLIPVQPPEHVLAKTIVVVLGESATAQRWSLLGYQDADTNAPLRNKAGVAATQVRAEGPNTASALPFMLTGFSASESVARQAASFIDLAHHAGYKTFVFTNSRFNNQQEDFYSLALRRSTDVYKKVGDGDFDEVLTPFLQTALSDTAEHKLIVLHTYGSHPGVNQRYPATRYQLPDPYDNSILYTSDLLEQWISIAQQSNPSSSLLLYASDHGLVMPPLSQTYRTGDAPSTYEVPLLLWSGAPDASPLGALRTSLPAMGSGSNAVLQQLAVRAMGYAPPDGKQ